MKKLFLFLLCASSAFAAPSFEVKGHNEVFKTDKGQTIYLGCLDDCVANYPSDATAIKAAYSAYLDAEIAAAKAPIGELKKALAIAVKSGVSVKVGTNTAISNAPDPISPDPVQTVK
jgi:hypothetical protein